MVFPAAHLENELPHRVPLHLSLSPVRPGKCLSSGQIQLPWDYNLGDSMAGIVPVNISATVTSAGTRVQISGSATLTPTSIYFEAKKDNGGNIFIGLSNVSSSQYIACLPAGSGFGISSDGLGGAGRLSGVGLSLSAYYADTSNSGDKVMVTYAFNQKGS